MEEERREGGRESGGDTCSGVAISREGEKEKGVLSTVREVTEMREDGQHHL